MKRTIFRPVLSVFIAVVFAVTIVAAMSGCIKETAIDENTHDILFQVSTINALLGSVYDGEVTFGELKRHGDFAIGTFNQLDGEMIGLNGKFYQAKTDGKIYLVDDLMKTPFAVVTFFEADKTIKLDSGTGIDELKLSLNDILPTKNIFYAIKIEGTFKYIKARSVPKQEKPYPKLVDVVKQQVIFEYNDIEGTIVGFWCPAYVKGVNVAGYHFHFISKDKKSGGHILDCTVGDATAEIDYTNEFTMVLPKAGDFYDSELGTDKKEELDSVEK